MSTSTDLRAAIEEIQEGLLPPSAILKPEELTEEYRREALKRLEQRIGAMPWWVISAAVHAVIFLLIGLVAVAAPPQRLGDTIITVETPKLPEKKFEPPIRRTLFERPKVPVEQETNIPMIPHKDVEVRDFPQTANDSPLDEARGDPKAISDLPMGEMGFVGPMGVGPGGLSGVWGRRGPGGRQRAVAQFGGSKETESAVEAALRWLARHQEADGHWDAGKHEATEKHSADVGDTGLAMLAFLAAGYTEKTGRFADNVRRAQDWLLQQQKPNGSICVTSARLGYNHAIAGLALAESFGMAGNPAVGRAAQRAVDYSIKDHQCPYSGWRYGPREKADMSVTGWFVMQLKSARMAGLRPDGSGLQGAMNFVDEVSTPDGWTGYTSRGSGRYCLTAVGLVSRQFMGAAAGDPALARAADHLLKELPDWNAAGTVKNKGGDIGFYYWYYGTLGMFQMGGDHWQKWNAAIKPTLVENQCKGPLPLSGEITDKDGSWDPQSWIDPYGGRVFTTALGALTLEVYYRYLPMYGK